MTLMADYNPEINICILGSGNVGKSALTIQYFQNQFVQEWDPTIQDLFSKNDRIDGREIKIEVQDTAGQVNFRAQRENFIRRADGFLIVFSLINQQPNGTGMTSFQEVQDFYDAIRRWKGEEPVILVGNKADLPRQRCVTKEEAQRKANELGNLEYRETSAKTRMNVDETFMEIIKQSLAFRDRDREAVETERSSSGMGCCGSLKCMIM